MILDADAWKEMCGWIYANQELKGQITCDIQMMQTGLISSWLAAGCASGRHATENVLLNKNTNQNK